VSHVDVHEIGAGLGVSSAVYRARLTGTDVPDSVVMKLTAIDEAAAFTSTVLGMYRREAKFFSSLANLTSPFHSRGVRVQVPPRDPQIAGIVTRNVAPVPERLAMSVTSPP